MVVHCLIFLSHDKINMSVHKSMNYKTQLRKKTYRVHKINESNFLNIEFKYCIPRIVEEQYITIYFCEARAF
jgi:hypothetical protein